MKLTKKGMTLFELLAVIVILGIIAAVAFPTVNGVINNARNNTFVEQGNIFENAAFTLAQQDYTEDGVLDKAEYNIVDLSGDLSTSFATTYAGSKITFAISGDHLVISAFAFADDTRSITFTGNVDLSDAWTTPYTLTKTIIDDTYTPIS